MRLWASGAPAIIPILSGLGSGIGYGLYYRSCAPPSVLCHLPGWACLAFCADAWQQFIPVFGFGFVAGILPALAAFTTTRNRKRMKGSSGPVGWLHAAASVAGNGLLGVSIVIPMSLWCDAFLLTLAVWSGLSAGAAAVSTQLYRVSD